MQRKWLQACAALCLAAACVGQVEAGVTDLIIRQDASPTEDNTTIQPTPTNGGDEEQRTTATQERPEATEASSASEAASTGDATTTPTSEPSPTAVPSAINGNTPDNSTETVREYNSRSSTVTSGNWADKRHL